MNKLSIVIPAYNEEKAISQTIDNLKNELSALVLEYEIIVVNDCSTDKTLAAITGREDVKLISHQANKGYGASLKTGIKQCQGDFILITDADGTYPAEAIPKLIECADNYDMVVGARIGKKTKIPLIRKPAKWLIGKLANYLAETKIPDLNSGLRIIKKELAEKFIFLLPNGFSFTTTITLAALSNNYSVKYLPIYYCKRIGQSKIKPIKDTLNFCLLIIRTILYFNPLKIFMPLALSLFLLAIIVFIGSYLLTPVILDTTVAIFVISAVQMLAIGMIADLIVRRWPKN